MSEQGAVEEQARAQGWVPKEEFRGGEANHKTAEEFLETGKKIAGVQKERNDMLTKKVTQLTEQMEAYQKQVAGFHKVHSTEMKAVKEDAFNRAMLELKKEQIDAVDRADVEAFKETEKKIEKVQADKAEADKITEVPEAGNDVKAPPEEFVKFKNKNSWYDTDDVLTGYANVVGERMSASGKYKTPNEWYDAIETAVRDKFPEKFQPAKEVPDVESSSTGSGGVPSGGKHKFSDLPADAQKACDAYVKSGMFKDRAAYVAAYPW